MDQPPPPRLCRGARQDPRGLRLAMICCRPPRTMRAVGEMNDDFNTVEMPRPVGRGADVSDREKFYAADGLHRSPEAPDYGVTALDEATAQPAADEAHRTGHQDASQAPPSPRRLCNR